MTDGVFSGPLFSQGFVDDGLPALLTRRGLFPPDLACVWAAVQQGVRTFAGTGGPVRVSHHIVEPLRLALGYTGIAREPQVRTREGLEDGGYRLPAPDGPGLRVWPIGSDIDLDSPGQRSAAIRSSPARLAARVMRAAGEIAGLLTNGHELRLLLCDPSGPDSHAAILLRDRSGPTDAFPLIAALASPGAGPALPDICETARLHQAAVTKTLRSQARTAIEDFLRCILDCPDNRDITPDAAALWREVLTVVYRLLFILKMESAPEAGSAFGFAESGVWRTCLSPNRVLGPLVRRHLDFGHDTGRMLEDGLRTLFRVFQDGLVHAAIAIAPLGGGLFDPAGTACIDRYHWGERAAALLLDRLLWTTPRGRPRERVHYGGLDVEELGRIYESLLDLQPAIASRPMRRVTHGRFEAVMDSAPADATIQPEQFFLRTGLGRRSGGSYFTPGDFVRILVRETLTPLTAPAIQNADPAAVLRIRVFDPAMGSGHFLVEACRFLADALYEAAVRCEALGASDRVDALPDPDRRLAAWLPSRSPDRSDSGPSRARAQAICRRMVAVHCLYGVDIDPLSVELAKLSLWLESFAEGMPLTFLDHRLLAGDSIAAPFFRGLSRLPVGGGDLDPLLAQGMVGRLAGLVVEAMGAVRALEASIGTNLADILTKQSAKDRLDRLMGPLRDLTRAWSGAVTCQTRDANDAWLAMARSVADTGALPSALDSRQRALLDAGAAALPLDLAFPEVFRPDEGAGGFHAVLGNPPWDVVHYQTREYLAGIDPSVMDAPTKREREAIERRLLADPGVRRGLDEYKAAFVERKRLCDRLFPRTGGGASIDLFQVFTERMLDCVGPGGAIGAVLPSSFHANEGTAALRQRLLDETSLESCFSFENRKKLFDVHGRLKFTLLVARRTGVTGAFRCGFYLDSIHRLRDPGRVMVYDRAFLAATGGESETFLELAGTDDLRVARHMFVGRPDMRAWMEERRIVFGREAHMTDDAHRFARTVGREDVLPLHEGKTFHQYTDRWKTAPRYAIPLDQMRDRPDWARAAGHYRLAFREISRSTDERTMIAAIVPPGHVFGHKGTCEKRPWDRPDAAALILCAIFNSFPFDWCVRRKIAASMSLFMLNACPAPSLSRGAARFLAHGALRLSDRHDGYDGLRARQLAASARMPAADRDPLRAAIDAAVAHAYGLGRDDYAHILTGFSHKSWPDAPARCLAAFDLLQNIGARAFYRQFDPFDGVPLVDIAARPAMEIPTASATLIPSMPAVRMPPA